MTTLPIWVTELPIAEPNGKAIFRADADAVLRNVPLEALRDNLTHVCESLASVVERLDTLRGEFTLREFSVQVEVSGEGGVSLIGSAKVAGKGAITLLFARK